MEALVPPGWAQRGDREHSLHNTFTEQQNFGASAEITWRKATCEEVGCAWMRTGWATIVDPSDPNLGAMQAEFIRHDKTRSHTELTGAAWNERGAALAVDRGEEFTPVGNTMAVFVFPPGTECMNRNDHRATEAVNPLFKVRDHWGRVVRAHSGPDPFLDDFRSSLERITQQITS
jgi:hypothetical protein